MADAVINHDESEDTSVGRTRSPNYPVYRLEAAIAKTKTLYDAFKRHQVPIKAIGDKLELKVGGSGLNQAIAALRAYGFIDVEGSGDKRKITVTEDAQKVLANHPDRPAILKKAALSPKIHNELYKKFNGPDGLPPDATIQHYLTIDREAGHFSDEAVVPFLRQFRQTLAFAKLDSSGKLSEEPTDSVDARVAVGDFVQWESQGVARFAEPRRVSKITEDGTHAYIEDSLTAVPVSQLSKAEPPEVPPPAPPHRAQGSSSPSHAQSGTTPLAPRQLVYPIDNGGELVVRWPEGITAADFEDIDGWLPILLRKIKRSVVDPENLKKSQDD